MSEWRANGMLVFLKALELANGNLTLEVKRYKNWERMLVKACYRYMIFYNFQTKRYEFLPNGRQYVRDEGFLGYGDDEVEDFINEHHPSYLELIEEFGKPRIKSLFKRGWLSAGSDVLRIGPMYNRKK